MAIVKDNILIKYIKGTLGKQITIYERNGVIIMAVKRGPSKKNPTPKQLAAREKMKVAVSFAKVAMLDPEMKAVYQAAAGIGQNAFNMAVKDAYNSPVIKSIQVEEEQTIIVKATDEFRVAKVTVEILDNEGTIIEKGEASLTWNQEDWKYRCEHLPPDGRIIVKAFDLPGNMFMKDFQMFHVEHRM